MTAAEPLFPLMENSVERRVDDLPWDRIASDLDAQGYAVAECVLTKEEAELISALYDDDHRFRSRIVMARHGFGRGEYKYFSYPLPDLVCEAAHRRSTRILRGGQPLERAHGGRRALSGRACRLF